MEIRGRRLPKRKVSRQPTNTELGTRVTAKAVPLAVVADSTATLETSTIFLQWQQATGRRGEGESEVENGGGKGASQVISLF